MLPLPSHCLSLIFQVGARRDGDGLERRIAGLGGRDDFDRSAGSGRAADCSFGADY